MRVLRSVEEVLQDYEGHGRGWLSWNDRMFYLCDDGVVRSLREVFAESAPEAIQIFVNGISVLRNYRLKEKFRFVLPRRSEFAL